MDFETDAWIVLDLLGHRHVDAAAVSGALWIGRCYFSKLRAPVRRRLEEGEGCSSVGAVALGASVSERETVGRPGLRSGVGQKGKVVSQSIRPVFRWGMDMVPGRDSEISQGGN